METETKNWKAKQVEKNTRNWNSAQKLRLEHEEKGMKISGKTKYQILFINLYIFRLGSYFSFFFRVSVLFVFAVIGVMSSQY